MGRREHSSFPWAQSIVENGQGISSPPAVPWQVGRGQGGSQRPRQTTVYTLPGLFLLPPVRQGWTPTRTHPSYTAHPFSPGRKLAQDWAWNSNFVALEPCMWGGGGSRQSSDRPGGVAKYTLVFLPLSVSPPAALALGGRQGLRARVFSAQELARGLLSHPPATENAPIFSLR